jgi:hypothetical protein
MRRASSTELRDPSGNKAYRSNLAIWIAVCAFLLCVSSAGLFTVESSAQQNRLTLRLLDPGNGKPLARVYLGILVWQQGRAVELAHAVTNADGIVTFHLPDMIPERVGITHSPDELNWCSDNAFPTSEILKTGIVALDKCDQGKLKTTPTAAAGELVLFARRVTFWERVRREIP